MTGDLRERLYAQPCAPFTIHVADGKEYHVLTRDHAHAFPNGIKAENPAYPDPVVTEISRVQGVLVSKSIRQESAAKK